ncbi:MAG: D-2-hydroxyacid dehydrogenase [Verrucomicrobiales bacterium]|nr:D-2-hydroxyacid dehydrogenase [Verrucomicrobiales bacterium]
MNIVVLDGYTLNPGDLSWDALKALGPCQIYERSAPEEVVPRCAVAEIVITNKVVISRPQIAQLPALRYIGVTATGFNIVDVTAARERGILTTNVPTYGTRSVAQMTFALLLELTQHAGHHAQTVRDGRWMRSPDFCYWDYPLIELDGLTLGVVGFGRIGRAVAGLAQAFGMRVAVSSRSAVKDLPADITQTELDDLFSSSDIVSLHCPLTPETKQLVNRARLARMKHTAFLLNTSRGGLIDEEALTAALNSGQVAGAGLDVLTIEPPPLDHPLLKAKNCLVTPHIAWATRAARARLMDTAVGNVQAFLKGAPQNVVN